MTTQEESNRAEGHCPRCGPNRWADIEGEHVDDFYVDEADFGVKTIFRILKCRGCEQIYFQKSRQRREWLGGQMEEESPIIQHWPLPRLRHRPKWLDSWIGPEINADLAMLLREVYTAFDQELPVLTAIGIRTIFDLASQILNVDPTASFARKLQILEESGKIGKDEKDALSILTEAGGAAAHRGWRPSSEELGLMLDIIEAFIYRTFFLENRSSKLKERVPPRPGRNSTQLKQSGQ